MLGTENDLLYFKHFEGQVRDSLPSTFQYLSSQISDCGPLRYAVLCLSASNLSNLDVCLHSRTLPNDARRSVLSPRTNRLHSRRAREYHDLARQQCSAIDGTCPKRDVSSILTAKVLLAYYQHASTDHLRFRLAVWETVLFVSENQEEIIASPTGTAALQLWHRLCTSHRPSKPPALLLEGEGIGSFSPNMTLPSATDYLYLKCVQGMSSDDLIYDILIRSMEIRSRIIMFCCTADICEVPEDSPELGSLAYRLLAKMTGRPELPAEEAEARSSVARGRHLMELLEVQRRRMLVWKSMVTTKQSPPALSLSEYPEGLAHQDTNRSSSHRDAMSHLYYALCQVIFASTQAITLSSYDDSSSRAHESLDTRTISAVQELFNIVDTLDFAQSNLADIYTFSLTEVLLQLTLCVPSKPVFDHVLDVIWPRMESRGRGYENSHIPTHLAKRLTAMMAEQYLEGRRILLYVPAIAEDTPKTALFDPDWQFDVVLYGRHQDGHFFIDRIQLR